MPALHDYTSSDHPVQLYTVAKDGALVVWECSMTQKEMHEYVEMACASKDKATHREEGMVTRGVVRDGETEEGGGEEEEGPVVMGTVPDSGEEEGNREKEPVVVTAPDSEEEVEEERDREEESVVMETVPEEREVEEERDGEEEDGGSEGMSCTCL